MRWDDLRTSENVEDRRGEGGGFGGGTGFGIGGGRLGIGTVIVLGLLGWALGIDPRLLIGGAEVVADRFPTQQSSGRTGAPPADDRVGTFVAKILGETEDVWSQVLPQQANVDYQKPRLVMFSGATQSACGGAQSQMGPFYCPIDRKVYLDTAFFQEMQQRFGGGGDFAYAYVIAHEIGHHVENLLGILPKVQQAQRRAGGGPEANQLSVRVELMADCLAGVWAAKMNERRSNITETDVRQAVAAATAIGDDRLQRQSQGRVTPDSFTHGSSEQRVRWLMTGLRGGNVNSCNTFQASRV
ncbi:neutral zinc metallopeptidase [Alsobacter sp. SYSU M60028]|uniref:Neutral zinc metallopeptidase n=1 Tax=Alsobacter ponti TaxID=2962936 RepID=A0ABT1LDR9_9HYPH|nr:neutral zinc metallopeptidase [Alsobacter ponti]MCP8939251.1 neutral zinc metallopeptidase [Alsobacter ponti]